MIRICRYGEVPLEEILARREEEADLSAAVAEIVAAVRREGDEALRRYAKAFDGTDLEELEVPAEALDRADRDWRELVGRVCCELAEQAEAVYRVRCGLGVRLK